MVNKTKVDISENRINNIPQELIILIQKKGEMGVWTYLSELPMEELNPDLILRLDALRSTIRYPAKQNDWFIDNIINSRMKTTC
ncbi:MAG: hypothetical protein H8E85_08420 [Candidatus Marinimicrobia bacterium]|nr:hypothetical protein [Candidatus Neomarinimicrobiota bacterium]